MNIMNANIDGCDITLERQPNHIAVRLTLPGESQAVNISATPIGSFLADAYKDRVAVGEEVTIVSKGEVVRV